MEKITIELTITIDSESDFVPNDDCYNCIYYSPTEHHCAINERSKKEVDAFSNQLPCDHIVENSMAVDTLLQHLLSSL